MARWGFSHIPRNGKGFSSFDGLVERGKRDRVTTWVRSHRRLRARRDKARKCCSQNGRCGEMHCNEDDGDGM